MRIAVPMETAPRERRVALVPESCKKLIAAGHTVALEANAGEAAGFPDSAYKEVGVTIETNLQGLFGNAELVCKIGPPGITPERNEVAWMTPGSLYLGSLMPLRNLGAVQALADRKITAFATDAIPRTTRAQAMDTLSSMASIIGYKGVLLGAAELGKYFPMITSAAGMVFPAKVFVIGAGVAGLQAIATARRLGANVMATDVRPEVKEQIESVGAKYVGIELKDGGAAGGGYAKELSAEDQAKQKQLLIEQCALSDVVITTALIGGVFAPKLLSAETVKGMKPGSVIVDLGADGGCNCEIAKAGETIHVNGVTIMAPLNLPGTVPYHGSLLFSRNLTNFLQTFTKDKAFNLDFNDDILQGAVITHGGEVKHAKTVAALQKARA